MTDPTETENVVDQLADIGQEVVEPTPHSMTAQTISRMIDHNDRLAERLRELHASFLHRYTWRRPGMAYWDRAGNRLYARGEKIPKSRYERIVRLIRSLTVKVAERGQKLEQLLRAIDQ